MNYSISTIINIYKYNSFPQLDTALTQIKTQISSSINNQNNDIENPVAH